MICLEGWLEGICKNISGLFEENKQLWKKITDVHSSGNENPDPNFNLNMYQATSFAKLYDVICRIPLI